MSFRHYHRANDLRRVLVDLGQEPALAYASGRGLPDRRQFNWPWLLGTFLTGVAGTALMGGALFAAVDGEVEFAVAPNHIQQYAVTNGSSGTPASRKSDRFMPQESDRCAAIWCRSR